MTQYYAPRTIANRHRLTELTTETLHKYIKQWVDEDCSSSCKLGGNTHTDMRLTKHKSSGNTYHHPHIPCGEVRTAPPPRAVGCTASKREEASFLERQHDGTP